MKNQIVRTFRGSDFASKKTGKFVLQHVITAGERSEEVVTGFYVNIEAATKANGGILPAGWTIVLTPLDAAAVAKAQTLTPATSPRHLSYK